MSFYLASSFLRSKTVEKWIMNILKSRKNIGLTKFGWLGWKYKPAFNKSDSSSESLCCARLLAVLLSVNVGRLQFLLNEDISFSWIFKDFCWAIWLCGVIDLLRTQKSTEDSYLDRRNLVLFHSFEVCWNSLLRLFVTLRSLFPYWWCIMISDIR